MILKWITQSRLELTRKKQLVILLNFAVPADDKVKITKRKEREILRFCLRTKKLWNMKVTVIPIVIGALATVPKGSEKKKTGGTGNQGKNRNHPDHSNVKIGKNTQKSPDDLRGLAVTYTPGEWPLAKPGWKNSQGIIIIIIMCSLESYLGHSLGCVFYPLYRRSVGVFSSSSRQSVWILGHV